MGAYVLTAGRLKLKLQAGKSVRTREHDTHVHLDELGLFTMIAAVGDALRAGLVTLAGKYAQRIAERQKLEIEQYPPHTLFCECRGCLPKTLIFRKG